MAIAVALCVFVLSSADSVPVALAAWPGNPAVNVALCTASGEQQVSWIVSDGAGGAIIAWDDHRSGEPGHVGSNNWDIYAQRVLSTGTIDPAGQSMAGPCALPTDSSEAGSQGSFQTARAKPATIRTELAALKRMFRLGVRAGKVSFRPEFPPIEVRNTRTGFFEEAELQAVLAENPDHVRPLLQFLALTGWRVSEAKSLRWAQVDYAGGVVRLEVGSTKTGAGRIFPFAALPALAALMRAQRERGGWCTI